MNENQTEREILETLAEQAPLYVIEIAQEVDSHPITVDRACARLHDGGYIHSVSRGYYRLTDTGRQQFTHSEVEVC
jgi:Mn-dependent DtxR family transcriptional regulator